jgi:hypothetical protein
MCCARSVMSFSGLFGRSMIQGLTVIHASRSVDGLVARQTGSPSSDSPTTPLRSRASPRATATVQRHYGNSPLPEPDTELEKPIDGPHGKGTIFPRMFSFDADGRRFNTGKKKSRYTAAVLHYPDGTCDYVHFYNHVGAIAAFFNEVAEARGLELELVVHNPGRGRQQAPEDREALAILAALAKRRDATNEAIGKVAGGRAESTISKLAKEGEHLLSKRPELDWLPEREARRALLTKPPDVKWGPQNKITGPQDRAVARRMAEVTGAEREPSPYHTRYAEEEIPHEDPLRKRLQND